MSVDHNTGSQIGYPVRCGGYGGRRNPVAIDTAGNVDKSVYQENEFRRSMAKCIDLDGFHHGDVLRNVV